MLVGAPFAICIDSWGYFALQSPGCSWFAMPHSPRRYSQFHPASRTGPGSIVPERIAGHLLHEKVSLWPIVVPALFREGHGS